jgi:DNA-binding protein YbaB
VRLPDAIGRLAAVRGTGEAANGLVRVVVDGTGDIVELHIEPRAMRLASQDVSASVREAFRRARAAAQDGLQEAMGEPDLAALGEVGARLSQLGSDAQRRLDDFALVAEQLSRRLG